MIPIVRSKLIKLSFSSFYGAYTRCLSFLIDRALEQEDSLVLNDDLEVNGLALLCIMRPKSDLKIIVSDKVEDNINNNQFANYRK